MTQKIAQLLMGFGLFFSASAHAEGYLKLGLMYLSEESGPEGSTSPTTRTMMDLGAGYVGPSGLVLGALYSNERIANSSNSVTRTGIGPTVGWSSRGGAGPMILGTYFLTLERTDGYKGKGYQIDLAYKFPLGSIAFAPQISVKRFSYDTSGGSTLNPNVIENRIDPSFVFWIDF